MHRTGGSSVFQGRFGDTSVSVGKDVYRVGDGYAVLQNQTEGSR